MSSTKNNVEIKTLIKKKEKKLIENRDKILQLNDQVSIMTNKLKEKRTSEKSVRVAMSRIETHRTTLQIDGTKRPPDRYSDIRNYSQMDMDCWRYNQLRDWFNTYALKEEIKYKFSPSKTGYTIKIDNNDND